MAPDGQDLQCGPLDWPAE